VLLILQPTVCAQLHLSMQPKVIGSNLSIDFKVGQDAACD